MASSGGGPTGPGETVRRQGGRLRGWWIIPGEADVKTGEMASPKAAIGGVRPELDPQKLDLGLETRLQRGEIGPDQSAWPGFRRRGVLPLLVWHSKTRPGDLDQPLSSSDVRSRLQQRQKAQNPKRIQASKGSREGSHVWQTQRKGGNTKKGRNVLGIQVCHRRSQFGSCERHGDQAMNGQRATGNGQRRNRALVALINRKSFRGWLVGA